jgi:uncharacterized protein YndB with AHSA1/START domain
MTSTEQATHRLGAVERSGEEYEVVFERRLDHPIDSVWLALTEPAAIEKWLATANEFELREGGAVELRWHKSEAEDGMRATITEIDPPRLLEWSGGPAGHPAAACRWELRPDGNGCVLTFTSWVPVEEIERRAAEDPEKWSPPSMLAGWHLHLGYLEDLLDGRRTEWEDRPLEQEWRPLYERYGGQTDE